MLAFFGLDPEHYDEWLTCSPGEAPRYLRQWMGTLETEATPLPPWAKRTKGEGPPPPELPERPDEPPLS